LLHCLALWLYFADGYAGHWKCDLLGAGMVLRFARNKRNRKEIEALEARFAKTNLTIVDQTT
jgi:hypothetical protein